MAIITGVYLSIEAPFASYLVDLVGNQATQAQIDRAEHTGRVVSGFALAIFVCGFLFEVAARKRISATKSIAIASALSGVIVASVFFAERSFIDDIVESSSPQFRIDAVRGMLARQALFDHHDGFEGMSTSNEETDTPTWKAFRGLFPFLAKDDSQIMARARSPLASLAREIVALRFPSEESLRSDVYDKAIEQLRKAFDGYREAIRQLKRAEDGIPAEQEKSWNQFLDRMTKLGMSPGKKLWAPNVETVRRNLAKQGLDLPQYSWNPWSYPQFAQAVEAKIRRTLNQQYSAAIGSFLGHLHPEFPRNIDSFQRFLAHPLVQERLRDLLGLPTATTLLKEAPNAEEFHAEIYEPMRARQVTEIESMEAKPWLLSDLGGPLRDLGKSAVRSMIVPVIAIGLSLAGLAVHVVKFANYTFLLIARTRPPKNTFASSMMKRHRARWISISAGLASLIAAAHTPALAITRSPLYQEMTAPLERDIGSIAMTAMTYTIEIERVTYPVGRAIEAIGPFRFLRACL